MYYIPLHRVLASNAIKIPATNNLSAHTRRDAICEMGQSEQRVGGVSRQVHGFMIKFTNITPKYIGY